MNRLITTSEAAELLRVSPRTVLNWIEREAIPYVALPPAGNRREYRIPLHGLLNSLSGTYDLASQLDSLGRAAEVGVSEEQLRAAEEQLQDPAAARTVEQAEAVS
jgi:excisionase family DNA binding protein